MEQSSLPLAHTPARTDEALASLKRRWLGFAALGASFIAAGTMLLQSQWIPVYAHRWAITASAILVYEALVVWRGLNRNRRKDGLPLLPTLGLGNIFTLTRGLLLALIGGFLFLPWPMGWLAWAPGVLYTLSDVLDYFDGFAARITRHTTLLGEYLDLEFDALGVLIAPLLAFLYGQVPIWFLTVAAARYAFVLGLWWRRRSGKPVYELTASSYRRILAGFLMGLVGVVLWPVFSPPGTSVAATVYLIPFLALFARDWLVASGRINPNSTRYLVWSKQIEDLTNHWLPVVLRAVILIAALWIAVPHLLTTRDSANAPGLWIAVLLIAGVMALGIAGRVSGLVMLGLIGFGFPPAALDVRSVLTAATAAITLLGTGAASLWQPEDRYFVRRTFGGSE